MKTVFAFLASLASVGAVCPNSCSGQGICGEFDQCTCYANFRGADCSQRICPYAPAWVTTPKGDLNFDGDDTDYTVYNTDSTISTGFSTLITQEHHGGDWESWPAYAKDKEGHFYMECANRGLCDRETGMCSCFAGYEGSACQRMVCPNDCSGKGTCQSTSYLTANPSEVPTSWYTPVASSGTYSKWDGDMAMSCKCDPGYSGPDCSIRMCPVGDDMLTQVNQVYETQFIDIFTDCEGTRSGGPSLTACPTAAAGTTIGGSIKLTFTDHFGEKHTTEPIDGVAAYAGEANHALASNAQAALRALPNNVFSPTATVHATFCEYMEPSQSSLTDGVVTVGATTPHAHAVRVTGPTTCTAVLGNHIYAPDGKVKVVGNVAGSAGGAYAKEGAGTGATCAIADVTSIETPLCIRLVVNFDAMSGDFPDLEVDVSEATHNGKTNAQDAGSLMAAIVTSRLQITNTVDLGYDAPSATQVAENNVYLTAQASSTTVTFASAVLAQATTSTFPPTTTVKVECGGSNQAYRNLGHYTVSSSTDTVLTLAEVIPASTIHTDCGASDGATKAYVRITLVSHVLRTGADTDVTAVAADTMVDLGVIMAMLQGANALQLRLGVTMTTGPTEYTFHSVFQSSSAAATLSSAANSHAGIAIFATESTVSIGQNDHSTGGNAAGVGTILGSPVASTANAIAANTLRTDAGGKVYVNGDGTHEKAECGARGLCDTEAGECKCFPGYVGLACEQQNALVA